MLDARTVIRAYRALGALLIAVAIGYQVNRGLQWAHWSPIDYFSYFTVLSNLIAAGVLAYGALNARRPRSTGVELLRGAAVLYMLTTGIVYAVLLSGQAVLTPWVNTVEHQLMPVVVLLDWLIDPPQVVLALRRTLIWLGFPLLYITYTLIRGPLADWYPYPFVDPRGHGYWQVVGNCLGVGIGIVALIGLITWVGNRRPRLAPARTG